ncbi:hypothetical protein [Parapedobacter sp. DT-150]|uniref:hypothetical protein n=1 Tax=Parapedobacter sp. DT-150 TaxID=3396162 RepID=UPI003F1B4156
MATKKQILAKITELLNDINDQYRQLESEGGEQADDLKGDLFEATVNYFAAHATLYNKLLKRDAPVQAAALAAPETEAAVAATSVDDIETEDDAPVSQWDEPGADTITFTPPIEAEAEQASHAAQIEEVSADDEAETAPEEIGMTDEEGDMTVAEEVHDEAAEVEGYEDDEADIDAEEEVADDMRQDEAEPEEEDQTDEAFDQDDTEEDLVESTGEGDDTVYNEVVHEVNIAEKEVTLPPDDLPQPTPQPADTPTAEEPEKPTRPLSLNELISAQRKAGTSGASSLFAARSDDGERVADIKSAISLNDKLLFIKDLFNGYSLAYSEAIELLNRYDDFASADAFLQANYASKNNWADKQTTVDKLYAIMRKRFG